MIISKKSAETLLILDIVIQSIIFMVMIGYAIRFSLVNNEATEMVVMIFLAILGAYQVLSALILTLLIKDFWRLIYFFASILVVIGLFVLSEIMSENVDFVWFMLLPALMGLFYYLYSWRFYKRYKINDEGV